MYKLHEVAKRIKDLVREHGLNSDVPEKEIESRFDSLFHNSETIEYLEKRVAFYEEHYNGVNNDDLDELVDIFLPLFAKELNEKLKNPPFVMIDEYLADLKQSVCSYIRSRYDITEEKFEQVFYENPSFESTKSGMEKIADEDGKVYDDAMRTVRADDYEQLVYGIMHSLDQENTKRS
ncbi:hypothetical protein I6N96_12700 [Enterococcus sp. BWM-S5]|uniref:Uncharacterized protein n=1 Tax=Enterococcus larvae TaxID=2794352 RepID=A0ABS4CKJ2_9ENTE|nr:hypothetical protein [Enterococcus larvae]MBP1047133.1 hypothetical protein [Enterococcus larvae]